MRQWIVMGVTLVGTALVACLGQQALVASAEPGDAKAVQGVA
jgi:hypothetical protein